MTTPNVASALLTADSVIIAAIGVALQRIEIEDVIEGNPMLRFLGIILALLVVASYASTMAYLHSIVYPGRVISPENAVIYFDVAIGSLLFILYLGGGMLYIHYMRQRLGGIWPFM